MADTLPHAPAAVVLLLAPAGAAHTAAKGLVMHLDGHAAPMAVPEAASEDMLQLASRLLQAASAWLAPAADPVAATAADASSASSFATTLATTFATSAAAAAGQTSPLPLKAGPFHVDGPHRLVRWRGPQGWRPIDLTDIERRLLCQLLAAAGQVCSRSDIAAGVWGAEAHNLRTVDQCVRRLRRSMVAAGVPDCIKTVRGVGYRLMPTVANLRGTNRPN